MEQWLMCVRANMDTNILTKWSHPLIMADAWVGHHTMQSTMTIPYEINQSMPDMRRSSMSSKSKSIHSIYVLDRRFGNNFGHCINDDPSKCGETRYEFCWFYLNHHFKSYEWVKINIAFVRVFLLCFFPCLSDKQTVLCKTANLHDDVPWIDCRWHLSGYWQWCVQSALQFRLLFHRHHCLYVHPIDAGAAPIPDGSFSGEARTF